jgi:hypothetical protein
VTYRTVGTNTVDNIFLNQNGVNYIIQYDSSTGSGRLIQANAPAGTQPIYQDGRWNASANQIGLTPQQQSGYHNQIQQLVYTAYQRAGGRSVGAVLGPWAQPQNFNLPPGQTSNPPAQNNSSSNQGTGQGLGFDSLTALASTLNVSQNATQFLVNGDAFSGAGNDSALFGRTMMYPMDMNIEQQDSLQITGYRYRPSRANSFFGLIDAGNTGSARLNEVRDILNNGYQSESNYIREQMIGLVILPMPNKVSDSNNVSWGEDTMNNLSAAATAAVMNNLGGIDGYAAAATAGGLAGNASAGVFLKAISDLVLSGGGSKELSTLLGPSLASKFLKMGGFGVDTESILARGLGIVPNSNMELLFNGPTLRSFTFTYRLSPREPAEASRVRRIIRFFKQSMAAKKITATGGRAGEASFFLGTPNIFKLEYKTNDRSGGAGGQFINGVNRFKTCALTSFQCDYTPDGFWAAYESGQPVSTVMSMTFNELEPIYDTDYQNGNIFSTRREDLQPVNPESVGY